MSNGFCSIHQTRERASELSRKAVAARKKNAERAAHGSDELVPASLGDIAKQLAVTYAKLQAGKIDAATARAHATVALALMKAFELRNAEAAQLQQIPDPNEDPADLSIEEWEEKYYPLLNRVSPASAHPVSVLSTGPTSDDQDNQQPQAATLAPAPEQRQTGKEPVEAEVSEQQSVTVARLIRRRWRRANDIEE